MTALTAANIQTFINRFNNVGDNSLTASLGNRNIFHRLVNRITGREANHNVDAMNNLVRAVRESPDFGSAYSHNILGALRDRGGEPLTGREAARLLSSVAGLREGHKTVEASIHRAMESYSNDKLTELTGRHLSDEQCASVRELVCKRMMVDVRESSVRKFDRHTDKLDNPLVSFPEQSRIGQELERQCQFFRAVDIDIPSRALVDKADAVLKKYELPEGARLTVTQILAEVPKKQQANAFGALANVVGAEANADGSHVLTPDLPIGTKVSVTDSGQAEFSFSANYPVSRGDFRHAWSKPEHNRSEVVRTHGLAHQFVADLGRSPLDITDANGKVHSFSMADGKAMEHSSKLGPEVGAKVANRFVEACGGNANEAFALSLVLNQSLAACVTGPWNNSKVGESMLGLNMSLSLGHTNPEVTREDNGHYNIVYSSNRTDAYQSCGNSRTGEMSVVQPDGKKVSVGVLTKMTLDLSGIGPNPTPKELADRMYFENEPSVTYSF